MAKDNIIINRIVAAFLAGSVFCGPAFAQTTDLDALFDRLAQAGPDEARQIQGQIQMEWTKSGSAAMDLLYRRGQDALESGDTALAVEHFSALIDHAPDFAAAYNGRATAYFTQGMIGQSLEDIRSTLDLTPRHFGAMRGLAIILEELDRDADALEIYRRVAALDPNAEGVSDAIDRLETERDGQTL